MHALMQCRSPLEHRGLSAPEVFAGYLVLDAWVANQVATTRTGRSCSKLPCLATCSLPRPSTMQAAWARVCWTAAANAFWIN